MTHIHLIGIGGSGLSAIALVLLESGYQVSGSDRQLSSLAERLIDAGVRVFIGHQETNVSGADLVIRSSAIADDNPEVLAALASGIPVLKRSDFLGQLTSGRQVIAVAGTHGKTTTTAMIAWMLTDLGLNPSYIIGGVSSNLGTNAHAGLGPFFVIEADEYDHMFLGLKPYVGVVTNIEHDHPDCYPTQQDYYQAFREFAGGLVEDGILLACGDDDGASRLAVEGLSNRRVLLYGKNSLSFPYRACYLRSNQIGGTTFDFVYPSTAGHDYGSEHKIVQVALQVPGEHNVLNSLAALAVADLLKLSVERAATVLEKYQGSGRRFEVLGEAGGVIVIDDYAHHPTEIRSTLAAARSRYPDRRIWVVWQPHTYSRTRALTDDFSQAFGDAQSSPVDHVVVTDIYAARETAPLDGFSATMVVQAMLHPNVLFIPDLDQVTNYLLGQLHPGDLLLVLSAGDADQISKRLLTARQQATINSEKTG